MNTRHRHVITPEFQTLLELPLHGLLRPLSKALAIFLFFLFATSSVHAADDYDPLEKANRITHSFNAGFDRVIVKPLANTYDSLTPKIAKTGIRNFFSNLDDVRVAANHLVQLKFTAAARDVGRFAVNSTVGVAGLFDVAQPVFALEKSRQDFGKTLAHWGVGSGPYLVLPFIGPSTARDAFGLGIDSLVDPLPSIDHVSSRNGLLATKTTSTRADYLAFDDLIIGDDYLFLRGVYLQTRDYAINGDSFEVAFEDF